MMLLAQAPATKVVDLSADFRLHDTAAYAKWYGHEHHAPELQKEAVYGLAEMHRREIRQRAADRQSGLLHDLRAAAADPADQGQGDRTRRDRDRRQVRHDRGGRAAKEAMLFSEVSEGFNAYGVGHHRHMAELDQEFSAAAGRRGGRDLHAASGADEPGHPLDHLCAGQARPHAAKTFMRYF